MKNSAFDTVIIGAGPAALAAMAAINQDMRIAVITGAAAAGRINRPGLIHSKIVSVARECRTLPGITNDMPFNEKTKSTVFDTAIIGGLANYWGQQFVRYQEGDPWPRQTFESYQDYLDACAYIESLFVCTPGRDCQAQGFRHATNSDYVFLAPNLLVGTPTFPNADFRAMETAVLLRISELNAERFDGSVLGISKQGGTIETRLDSGECIRSERVLIAAGVVGSLRLVMRSCPEVHGVQFADHVPHMVYFLPKPGALSLKRIDGLNHFNVLTVEQQTAGMTTMFASLYRMSCSSIGLILASLGLPPILPSVRPPWLVDMITPAQIWTKKTIARYQIDRNAKVARFSDYPDRKTDPIFREFVSFLRKFGLVLASSTTDPGFGFHFHDGRVTLDNANYHPVNAFIRDYFDGAVQVVDAAALPEIGSRPPALTSMANAYASVKSLHATSI